MKEPAGIRTPAAANSVDWQQVKDWDERYVFHVLATSEEYQSTLVESAEGCYVTLAGGKRLFDFANQLVCVNMGHRHPRIQAAIREATEKFGYIWEGLTTEYRSRAAKLIMEDLEVGKWAGRIRFLSTGTESVENMVLFAKLYSGRRNIVTRSHDYHGWTNALSGANGVRGYRSSLASGQGAPVIRDVPDAPSPNYHFAPAPHCYRCPIGHTYPNCKDTKGTLACVRATEHVIRVLGPETVAGFLTEPAQGAGMIHPPPEYFPQIREMTQRLGILWLDDEVMTGFGRLGEWFGYKCYDVTPDIMSVAKGLISSALPAGGVVLSKQVAEFFDQWRFSTMSTFGSHPLAMAAICANLEAMVEENILERVRDLGAHLGAGLIGTAAKAPVPGAGLRARADVGARARPEQGDAGALHWRRPLLHLREDPGDAGKPDCGTCVPGGRRGNRRVSSEQHSPCDCICSDEGRYRFGPQSPRQGAVGAGQVLRLKCLLTKPRMTKYPVL